MALTVEDGTGLAAADAYESASETDARLVLLGYAVFPALSEAAQEPIIRRETAAVDAFLSEFASGHALARTQARLFPRVNSWTRSGRLLGSSEVPDEIKAAVALRCEARAAGKIEDLRGEDGRVIVSSAPGSSVQYARAGRSFRDEEPEAFQRLLPLMEVA